MPPCALIPSSRRYSTGAASPSFARATSPAVMRTSQRHRPCPQTLPRNSSAMECDDRPSSMRELRPGAGRTIEGALQPGRSNFQARIALDQSRRIAVVLPYIIVYDHDDEVVTVLRVLHGKRNITRDLIR